MLKMAGTFRSSVWDPVTIISQIFALQTAFYLFLGLWIILLDIIADTPKSFDQMFRYDSVEFKSRSGKLILLAFLLNTLTCAVSLWFIVQRAKQCLDFAATIHFYHLVACWIYTRSFPATLTWWLLMVVSTSLTTVLGEYICMRSELKAIPLSSVNANSDSHV